MAKSELKAERKSSKRKLSEVAEDVDDSATAAPAKKAKKDKKDKSDKKSKKDKHDKKSRKEIKAEQADDLNHAEYDIEDKAIDEAEPVVMKNEEEKKKEKKEKKSKKEKKAKAEKEDVKVEEELLVNDEVEPASKKKSKKDKKDKKAKAESKSKAEEPETNGDAAETVVEGDKKKTKKDKKDKKSKKSKNANGIEIKDEDLKINNAAAAEANGEANGEGQSSKNNRFICFIGNLPFTATKADVEAHFSALAPSSVRLLTEKDNPTKSRGIAFIEFDHFSRMKTCLAKFHHTEFTDSAGNVRKINVELTAGGGGKKEGRMDKVKERNFKLNEERARRIAKEEEEKRNGGKKAAEVKKEVVVDEREDAYVHPSRRAHVPGRRM